MKKYILLTLVCFLFLPLTSFMMEDWNHEDHQIHSSDDKQEAYFYYYKGNKKYLKLNPQYIFVSGTDANSVQRANLNTSVRVKTSLDVNKDLVSQTLRKPNNFKTKQPVRYWTEIELSEKYSTENYQAQIETLRANTNLIVAPYFESETGNKIGLSNYFYVKLKESTDFNILIEQAEKHKLDLVGYNKFMPLWFTLSTTPESRDALSTANLFFETGLFQYAEPALMVDKLSHSVANSSNTTTANDPYYPDQWHLNNTEENGGVTGIDINIEGAWNITRGDNITVGVIDSGFEMNHPDLVNNTIGTGYDPMTGSSPSRIWGNHGTPSAGIIGAEGDNNLGVIGVAPNCNLSSISVHLSFGTPQHFADAVNWATQNGADVISNSWGADVLASSMIDDAIDNALTNGRGGLGAIMVVASGNNNIDGAQYPANSNDLILCVGGIDRCGVRSGNMDIIAESCDPWIPYATSSPGSNFGAPLDVVAGGSNILTTDLAGAYGYNDVDLTINGYPDTDYHYFSGTSAACPQVAGVAALVLSVNSNLTVQQVNDIIEQSAQKTRPDLYNYQNTSGRPNGTWNNELGYGLVDAYQAVLLAQETCPTNLVHSDIPNLGGNYIAENIIISTATVGSNKSLTYRAGRQIILGKEATSGKGFLADAANGSVFLAEISDGCYDGSSELTSPQEPTEVSYNYTGKQTEMPQQITTEQAHALSIKNYPNPFTGQTTIVFDLPEDAEVILFVSDINGKQIARLLDNKPMLKGSHQLVFDGNPYPAGMYYYTIQTGEVVKTGKMVLAK